ncbi:hypothetical protein AAFF_G00385980 [Aldrovandia affinis]|uniref:RHD domain-containing protein n=1 Tax=Aldrovandia affinis TaxID=143900 RepID=A0AAD7WLK4_9TELE|nr:hypothetical protein AAFF_G00385980 [Aldrovandia affinis]
MFREVWRLAQYHIMRSMNQDEPSLHSQKVASPPSGFGYPHEDLQSCSRSPYREPLPDGLSGYEHPDPCRPGGPALSPRIEITLSHELYHLQAQPVNISTWPSLTVPGLLEGVAYREPQCLSPASSNSSTSWHSESYSPWASPCVSPSGAQTAADLCPHFQNIQTCSPRTSPTTSPRTSVTEETYLGARSPSPHPGSRSTSPQGKRTYDMYQNTGLAPHHRSRSPSPHGGHDDHRNPVATAAVQPYGHSAGLAEAVNGLGAGLVASVPTKIVKPNLDYQAYAESQPGSCLFPCEQEVKGKPGESFYVIPQIWQNQLVPSLCSVPVTALLPLECPIPSRNDQYELRVEVQPKPHHRARYETEGSRGAVKAPSGGHPVVQLQGYQGKDTLGLQIFIGTADERILKPHAFYQVHRITGKTVTTTSYEKVIHSTKILEIPLEPKNNMRAVIDCAGILKLRNADIELRKGETDIGRKNTRVRLVFRVHIPQPGAQHVSLQVASHPIECSQRSAHELPMVEKQDIDSCSVLGGQQMILTGQNFTSESKVVFSEKTHDGQQIWDMEASVDRDKSQASMLFVEVPPYRDLSVCHAAKVNFYVINGKRKRSQPQHFAYTPLPVSSIKTEPIDDYQTSQMGYALSQVLGVSPQSYYHGPHGLLDPDSCLLASMASPCQLSAADPRFQPQNPTVVYSRGGAKAPAGGPLLYQQHGGAAADGRHAMLVHAAEPSHTGGQQLSVSPGQHPSSSSSSSILHFSPANHLLRGAVAPPPGHQPLPYRGGFHAGHPAPAAPTTYHGVVQQQPHPKVPRSRSPPGQADPQRCPPGRVTVKQENLDQVYLDDVNEIIRKDLTVHGRGQT